MLDLPEPQFPHKAIITRVPATLCLHSLPDRMSTAISYDRSSLLKEMRCSQLHMYHGNMTGIKCMTSYLVVTLALMSPVLF